MALRMRTRGRSTGRGSARGSKRDTQREAEAQAALAVAEKHTEAGWRAQTQSPNPKWAPPQAWSQSWPPPYVSWAEAAATPEPQPRVLSSVPNQPPSPTLDVSADIVRVLETVTNMCDHVIEYIESDRAERRLMIDAITQLIRSMSDTLAAGESAKPATRERVVGGKINSGDDDVVDVREPDRAVEVRCRFGDRWVDGFEICETIEELEGPRYRLRRQIDGVVLPELFDAADIRHVETFQELTSTPEQQRHWSPL